VLGGLPARHGDTGILLRHEPVPGLMDEMDLMSLDVESCAVLERAAVPPGDRLRVSAGTAPRLVVTEIQWRP
jgi:hypothetical protein